MTKIKITIEYEIPNDTNRPHDDIKVIVEEIAIVLTNYQFSEDAIISATFDNMTAKAITEEENDANESEDEE